MSTTQIEFSDIDFLIIGAAKSATTWLQTVLQSDPKVAMPDPELHYFSRHFENGNDWYLAQFPDRASSRTTGRPDALIGEKSNSYLSDPGAPARINAVLGHARLIAQLRNPVDRAYSDYCMLFRRGEVNGDINQHLSPAAAADGRFLGDGLYAPQLQRFADLFPADQLRVIPFENIKSNPNQHVRDVRQFLGLTEPFELATETADSRVKDKRTAVVGAGLRRVLKPIKPLVAPFRNTSMFRLVRNQIARPVAYPPLTNGLRQQLTEFYASDIERVAAISGNDFKAWLEPASETTT